MEVRRCGHPGSLAEHAKLLARCAKGVQWARALWVLHDMRRLCYHPNLITHNTVLHACGNAARWQAALMMLDEAQSRRLQCDIFTYASAIAACERGREWQLAIGCWADMHQCKIRPNVVAYSSLISACQKGQEPGLALDIMDAMPTAGICANRRTYGAAMSACETASAWIAALRMLSVMQATCLDPDGVALLSALRCLELGGSSKAVLRHCLAKAAAWAAAWTRATAEKRDEASAEAAALITKLRDGRPAGTAVYDMALRREVLAPMLQRLSVLRGSSQGNCAASPLRTSGRAGLLEEPALSRVPDLGADVRDLLRRLPACAFTISLCAAPNAGADGLNGQKWKHAVHRQWCVALLAFSGGSSQRPSLEASRWQKGPSPVAYVASPARPSPASQQAPHQRQVEATPNAASLLVLVGFDVRLRAGQRLLIPLMVASSTGAAALELEAMLRQ